MAQFTPQFLSGLDYRFNIKRLPHTNFFIQQFSLPSVSMGDIRQPSPFSPINRANHNLTYGEISITAKVDEDMKNYAEIYDWMVGLGFPRKFDEYNKINNSDFGLYSDASLIIMSSQKNPSVMFNFTNCFPTSISPLTLDTTVESVVYLDFTIEFRFDTFEMKRLRTD